MTVGYAPAGWAPPHALQPRRERALLRFGEFGALTLLHLDMALIALWFVVTASRFEYDELLLYPLTLYFTGMFVWRRNLTWPVFQRGLLLLLLPAWWIASSLWSPEPAMAFRSGLQSTLSILICMFVASRLTTRQFLAVLLVAMTVLAIRCLPQSLLDFSLGRPSKAIYSHKNSLGISMAVFFAVTIAMIFAPGLRGLLRLLAMAMAPVALFLIFASKSATAILIALGISGILFGALLFLGRYNRLTVGRLLIVAICIVIAAFAAMLAFNLMTEDPVDLVLNVLGKDRNLTGRSDLWAIGAQEMEKNPVFGQGAHGFWRYDDSAQVRQIFIDNYKARGNSFYFHNSWLEIGVALGWVGVALAAAAVIWAFGVLIRRAVTAGGPENWALLAIAVAILIRTMTESDLFSAFNMLHMLFWSAALTGPDTGGTALSDYRRPPFR